MGMIRKIWHFIWEEDSLASWVVNVILAFILVKFVIYPGLGFLLGTSYPVVAVVSGSMEHGNAEFVTSAFYGKETFENWWEKNKEWYLSNNISKAELKNSNFPNGFNKGDIIILVGEKPKSIKIGDVIVYFAEWNKNPIIHRVVDKWQENGKYAFETKGDNNQRKDFRQVEEENIIGKAVLRLPLLGWVKIWFTMLIS